MKRTECKNCERIFEGNFCPNCGQGSHEHRINAHYFLHDIPHSVFHVDGGFLYTLKMLFTRPGVMIREFLEGKRARHFRPFAYVMIITAISALIVKLLVWGKLKILQYYNPSVIIPVKENFFEHYFSLFIFLMIPVASLITWLFFIRGKYNFWEHFLANTYISAQLNIIWILSHLISFFAVIFTKEHFEVNLDTLFIFFMMAFLYLYGSVFGYLFGTKEKMLRIVLTLTVMNFILFVVYFNAFKLAGLLN